MKKLLIILFLTFNLTVFSQSSEIAPNFDKLRTYVDETQKAMDKAFANCSTATVDDFEYNTIGNPVTLTTMDAKKYLGTSQFKAVYISTKNRTKFPTILNSKGILGAPFVKSNIFRLIITKDSDGKIYHFFLNWN